MTPSLHLEVAPRSAPAQRFHVLVRLLLLMALGSLGWGGAYWALYLAIPALAAVLISDRGGAAYRSERGPSAERILAWLASAYAYLWLLTDEPPRTIPRSIQLSVERHGAPTVSSALWRLVTSIPALVVLMLCSVVAGALWVIGALAILITEHLPTPIASFLELVLRYQLRWMAYHLSLVDEYPTFASEHHDLQSPTHLPV